MGDAYSDFPAADVIFSSNTLEHLENPDRIVEKMCAAAQKYVVNLIPFEDAFQFEEHINVFNFESFPLQIGDFYLESCRVMDCSRIQGTWWGGKQIMVVYTNRNYRPQNLKSLLDIQHNFGMEHYGKYIASLKQEINDQTYLLNEKNKLLRVKDNLIEEQAQHVEQLLNHLRGNHTFMGDLYNTVAQLRTSKWHRLMLMLRRVKQQALCRDNQERKDFLKWIRAKLKGQFAGKPMHAFDYLYSIEQDLLYQCSLNDQLFLANMNQDPKGAIRKNSRQVFIFAGVPYYDVGGGQRFAQIANTLNNMGYRVYYVYGFESSESKRETMYIPAVKHVHLDRYSVGQLAKDIDSDAVLIFEIPYGKFKPYMDYANANGYATVYEHVDNWDSSLGCVFYNPDDFREFIRDVKHITVTARVLGEKIEEAGRKDYLYCANAVDSALFEPTKAYKKPGDLVTGKKTLLYFGSLWGEWFDWDLVVHVAKNCDCAINMIGDYMPIKDKIKTLPKNIHFLGLKKHDELPAYLAYSDIALLPFKNSIIGKYVSPLKIFEYIAMNKPVLATPLDDIIGYPNVVLSEDKEVWAKAVNDGIDAVDATVFTAQNSWYARCNQLMDYIGNRDVARPSLSIIILNRNNMKVIFRCVESLLAFSGAYNPEIIVVDNDSTDGSYEKLIETYGDKIKVIKNDRNGCSCGRNLGVRHATGEMLLFLDSDQWVIGDHYLDAALDLLQENSHVGAVGWAAGWFNPDDVAGPIADYLPNRGITSPLLLSRTDIAYLGSGGLLMTKSLFEKIEGFDEFYDPTCFEDTDLSLKIRHAGYELAYCPYTAIMHLPHQTTHSGNAAHEKLMQRNGTYFMDKWKQANPKLLEYRLK